MLATVAVLVLPPVTPFEFGTVCEVFGSTAPTRACRRSTSGCAARPPGSRCPARSGRRIMPDRGLDGLRGADLVVVSACPDPQLPAGGAGRAAAGGRRRAPPCSASARARSCSGAAGLLDDRACTTHWMYVDELRERHPRARVDPDVLFVDDGNVITSAGTAAGIDACLHLVRRELGSAVVNAIARRMVVPPQRDGGQRQYVRQPVPECSTDGLAAGAGLGAGEPAARAHGVGAGPAGADVRPQLRPPVRGRDRHHPAPLAHPAAGAAGAAAAGGHRPGRRRGRRASAASAAAPCCGTTSARSSAWRRGTTGARSPAVAS